MIKLATILKELTNLPEDEIFSAYHGRYLFNVSKAYDLIKSGQVHSSIKPYKLYMMKQLSHQEFSAADPKKIKALKIDYSKPLGIVVKFKDPESQETEWILIDGNHRTRKAVEEEKEGLYYEISDPKDVAKFLKINKKIPHKLFQDDDE